jgi:hypothetical protein
MHSPSLVRSFRSCLAPFGAGRFVMSAAVVLIAIALAGCGARSISNSGYEADSSRNYGRHTPTELSEFQVLGIDPSAGATETEIRKALENRKPVVAKKGSGILLVQSAAAMPDEPMRKALERSFNVAGFTGIPAGDATPTAYASALRLAAARAGCENIVVYWGVLETASENRVTKNISWVPFLGWGISDENQLMRIRLKVAVIDTQTGQWNMFAPEAIDDTATSSYMSRKSSDARQVESLKEKAYVTMADDIIKRFSR